MAWTYGPTSFANTEEAKTTLQAASQAGTIPSEAAQAMNKLGNAYSSTTGPAFTVTGNGEEGVNGNYTITLP